MRNLLLEEVKKAHSVLEHVVIRTPLLLNRNLSDDFDPEIFLKREDMQVFRSYKIRGAIRYWDLMMTCRIFSSPRKITVKVVQQLLGSRPPIGDGSLTSGTS